MKKSTSVLGLLVLSLSSVTYALDPLGPPKAVVGHKKWSFGIEYAYSETDIFRTNIINSGTPDADTPSKGLKAKRAYATIRYGLLDRLDVFGRFGATTMESPIGLSVAEFQGGVDVAWGFGAAITLYDSDRLDWGLLAQWSHGESQMDLFGSNGGYRLREMETECLQVATGPTYRIRDDLSLFAGGFYHALRGEYQERFDVAPHLRFDIEEDSSWGGFAGLDWAVRDDVRFHAEVQHTGTAVALTTSLNWLFQ